MSPQPTTAPAPAAQAPIGSPHWLMAQAKKLEKDRGEIMDKIGAVRTQLRNLDKLGGLPTEVKEFAETFYPKKEKDSPRSKEDSEATRKARQDARKG
jgi:hypothetical protein